MASRQWALFAMSVALLAVPCAADLTNEPGASLATLRLDPRFGTDGEVRAAVGAFRRLNRFVAVAVDSEGRVLAAGQLVGGPLPAVARFHADGAIDRSFGDGGVAHLRVRGDIDDIVVDGRDRVLVVGRFKGTRGRMYGAARLTARGRIDRAFSGDGFVQFDQSVTWDWRMPRLVGPDGGIAAVVRGFDAAFGIARLDADGEIPQEWRTPLGVAPLLGLEVKNIAVDAQGRVLVCSDTGITRLRTDGLADAAFGDGGTLRDADGVVVQAVDSALAVDGDGRIVMRRREFQENSLARFLPDGTPDPAFSGDGRARWATGAPGSARLLEPRMTVGGGAAERWVFTSLAHMDHDGEGDKLFVSALDPSAPGAISSCLIDVYAPLGESREHLLDTAVAPDGSAAYVVGYRPWRRNFKPTLRKIDLTAQQPVALPDLRVEWVVEPVLSPPVEGSGRTSIRATMRVTNAGAGTAEFAEVNLVLSDDAVFDDVRDSYAQTWRSDGPLGPGESFERVLADEEFRRVWSPGQFVLAVANPDGVLMETDFSNNVAVSAPLE